MAKDNAKEVFDAESDQAFQVIIDQARIRLEIPGLMARLLDRNPVLVHRAIRDWAGHTRPISDIAEELRQAVGEE